MALNNVFISPSRPDWDLAALVGHELSHLHLSQHVGLFQYNMALPEWFKEGLAVVVSGAGGEGISPEDAIAAIQLGMTMTRHVKGHLPRRTADNNRLGGFMFYRQSALFTGWLREQNPEGFDNLLRDLLKGEGFEPAFIAHMPWNIEDAWQLFVAQLES